MDAEYLKKNVGVVLSDGLASVLLNNPEDPVDYLSQYLLKYVDNQKRSEGQIQNRSKIAARELVVKCEQAQRNEKIEATAITRANILIADQRFADSADSCSTILQLLSLFANHFCQRLEATGVYIGVVEDVDDGKRIRYISASDGHEFMVGQLLSPPAITFDLFKDVEPSSEEGDADPASSAQIAYEPKVLLIANTILGDLSQKLTFFRRKDVGSYAAIAVDYESLLHEPALSLADGSYYLNSFPTTPPPSDSSPPIDRPAEPVPELVKAPRTPYHIVIAFDTIGQSRELRANEMDESRRLIMMLRTALIGVDERAFNSERSWRKEEVSSRISQEDEARIMEEVKANVGGDGPFVVERIAHGVAQKCIERRAETLSGLRRLSCPIGPVQVLNALFVVLEIDVPAHLKPHQIVDQTVLDSIRLLDPSKPGMFDVKKVGDLIEGLDVEKVKETSSVYAILLQFVISSRNLQKCVNDAIPKPNNTATINPENGSTE